MSISPNDVWLLPHSHYLAYMKYNITYDLQESEEGQQILDKFEKYMNPRTDADISAIRQFAGNNYAQKKSQQESG